MPFRVTGPRGGLVSARATAGRLARTLTALVRRFHRLTITAASQPATASPARPAAHTRPHTATPTPIAMYDSVTVSEIPADAAAVAGYVNGLYQTFHELERSHPNARRLSITVNAQGDADCLDIESGDATPGQAPAWVHRQARRGLRLPVVYCSASTVAAVLAVLRAAGIGRAAIRLWTAHYTGTPHLCNHECGLPAGVTADATQWTDKALGRNLDESLCAPSFL